jgi:hypothetical protein
LRQKIEKIKLRKPSEEVEKDDQKRRWKTIIGEGERRKLLKQNGKIS